MTDTPLFRFDGFATGDELSLAKGSRLNTMGIGGKARVERLEPGSARFWIKGGKFGVSKEAVLDIERTGPKTARLLIERSSGTDEIELDVVDVADGRTELAPVTHPEMTALLEVQADGNLLIEFRDPHKDDLYRFVLQQG